MTPFSPPVLPSPPGDISEQCRRDTERRRKAKRDACRRFISIRVPAHRRKVCVQDLGTYLVRKLKRRATTAVRKRIRERLGFDPFRRRRRPKIPDVKITRDIEIDIEDLIKG